MEIPNIVTDPGLEIVGVTAFHSEVTYNSFADLTKRCGNFPTSVANLQPFERTNIHHQQKPDIFIGHSGETVWAAKQGFPTVVALNRLLVQDLSWLPSVAVVTAQVPEKHRKAIRETLNLGKGITPKILYESDSWKIRGAVEKEKPAFILGSSLDKDAAERTGHGN